MTVRTVPWALLALLAASCVEKDPDAPTRGRRPLTRAEKERVKKQILAKPPAKLSHRVNANLDNKVVYLGMDTTARSVTPGKPITVVHYFQVKQPLAGWKLFVHTNGPNLSDFRNFDHVPVFGLHPVSKWKPGDIIRDEHSIVLPKSTRYKTVDIYVGIWRGASRLKVLSGKTDGKSRVLAARLPVGRAAGRRAERPLRRYVVRRARGKIVIDGKADEADWKAAPSTGRFVASLTGKAQEPSTEAKLLWDDQHLYVFFRGDDDDVWAQVTKPDDLKMWTEQVFELFLDADGNGAEYIELQVSPRGVIFDAYLPRPGQAQTDWSSGVSARALVLGTLNKRTDKDQGWQVELALPWAAVRGRSKAALTLPPKVGQTFRANLFRTDKPKDGPLVAWAWSPPLRGTFHALDRFGVLAFANADGVVAVPAAVRKPGAMAPSVAPKPKGGPMRARRPGPATMKRSGKPSGGTK